jgi:hypothetical protein
MGFTMRQLVKRLCKVDRWCFGHRTADVTDNLDKAIRPGIVFMCGEAVHAEAWEVKGLCLVSMSAFAAI